MKRKLIRITTVPVSFHALIRDQPAYMKKYFDVLCISSGPDDFLLDIHNREGVKVYRVNMSRTINPLKDLVSLFLLYRSFIKEKPYIIHTHTPKAGTLGMIAAWLCRVPVRMHTVAGLPLLETKGPKRALLDFVEKATYACATKVYPNSFGLKEIIIQNKYCKPEKLKVIGNGSSNGINTQHFFKDSVKRSELDKISLELKFKTDSFVFTFIGRLVKDKGINELVEAFVLINKQFPKTKLLLVGNYEAELDSLKQETLKEIDNNTAIISVGYQADVRAFLALTDVLVFPSYREGFPNVPLQSLAMEVPAIVSDINGCNEIVRHEYNGLLIPPKNIDAIVNAMERMILDANLYTYLKSNARESVVSRYDQLIIWNLIKKEYDEQLKIAGITSYNH